MPPFPPTETGEMPRLITVNEKTIEALSRRCIEVEDANETLHDIAAKRFVENQELKQELSTLRQSRPDLTGSKITLRNRITELEQREANYQQRIKELEFYFQHKDEVYFVCGKMKERLTAIEKSHGELVRGLQWALRNLHITFVKGGPQEDVKEFKDAQQALTNASNLKG